MQTSPAPDQPLKAHTGIPGLDEVLAGGFPRNRLFLLQGDPGVGKTTLALQFLMEGVRANESCLYVTLSETAEELKMVAASHGWSLDGIHLFELPIGEGLDPDDENTLFHPSEVELAETTKLLLAAIEEQQPARLVFDSMSEIRLLAQSPLRYRRQVLALKHFFAGRQCTVLLLDDRTSEAGDLQLQSIAHGVIVLDQLSPLYGAERRRLRVLKMRGVRFRGGYHDFILETGGMRVFPRLVASEHQGPSERRRLSSGIVELDRLVGGGLEFGASMLLMGPAGSGKSTLAIQYVISAAKAGVRTAVFAFDEGASMLRHRTARIGLDLEPFIASGMVELRQVDPAELAPGEFAHAVRSAIETRDVRLVVIDTLNGYLHAMPEEHFLTLQLHELLCYLAQMNVLTLMVVAQHGFVGAGMESPVDVSYLADGVIIFRHVELDGKLSKAVSVLKKRSGGHEATIRELSITNQGIVVGEPLLGFQGVLTGVPQRIDKGGT